MICWGVFGIVFFLGYSLELSRCGVVEMFESVAVSRSYRR